MSKTYLSSWILWSNRDSDLSLTNEDIGAERDKITSLKVILLVWARVQTQMFDSES